MSTQDRLRAFIVDDLGWPGSRAELTDDRRLIDDRVIDSMGIFQLVSFIETDLGVAIEDDDLVPDNFASLTALAALIERRRDA